ncbi:Siroheme synthase / Precorrin-2 oxidase / Sirohydrochlorin ferrochelatase / Uroporphyrinogen-III methyltransferase [Sphingobium herbicidovorans NBRC 16415]|uniref:precorrin-2 dehydrogenase n=1 Tax=Sphingobium herbicidovorans (strain ATCC 700291 / DSM 11019 / CCUG 56400 / KCTC 2939 / LMG 18315 / NBRC 16415 / MH) TaxID=1219045 RepID=A0A086PB61_SPHHM|nr:bifunctional precorrin-2 dehydrogenase/sirohydrochlorin ferrochelatase [Sphingobium herbicidovorans]KFG90629.1 Siroheme synthase / Precorrin-2 oxidase / Sirohydrochlorin ferrochelatase / Uroporphyrinogen-III methyltransferase [Sphingobium herbicidovorans NBRC 16415]
MQGLPVFLILKGRPVILTGAGEAAEAKRRLLERAGACIVGEDGDAALAIVADGDEATVARLKARGVLVNATDRPNLCDFTLPAIIDRDPVLIAIGTGGASAGLAKALRQRIEALLPQKLGALASALHDARAAIRARWPDAGARRRAIDAGLASGGPMDPFRDDAADAVPLWLTGQGDAAASRLVHIPLLSGDPDDLTLRAARLLGEADRVYHAADVPSVILDRARADAVRLPADAPPVDPGEGLSLWLEMPE